MSYDEHEWADEAKNARDHGDGEWETTAAAAAAIPAHVLKTVRKRASPHACFIARSVNESGRTAARKLHQVRACSIGSSNFGPFSLSHCLKITSDDL